ncbi:MAG TPA: hypothetical protein PLV68_06980, partial [Ilumatobacteraceae bacterium]|nr:hypothetical protein [Ilumatobacteraceae bacterium]
MSNSGRAASGGSAQRRVANAKPRSAAGGAKSRGPAAGRWIPAVAAIGVLLIVVLAGTLNGDSPKDAKAAGDTSTPAVIDQTNPSTGDDN